MYNNSFSLRNTKGRRLLMIFMSICVLVGSLSFIIMNTAAPQTEAADVSVSSTTDWTNYVVNASADTINVTLTASIGLTRAETATGLQIPAGKTVNLNLANYNVSYDFGNTWANNGGSGLVNHMAFLFTNYGTFNITSGNTAALTAENTSANCLSLSISRTSMNSSNKYEMTNAIFSCVRNVSQSGSASPVLTVGSGVSMHSNIKQETTTSDSSCSESNNLYSTCIWSTDDACTTNLNTGCYLFSLVDNDAVSSLKYSGWAMGTAYGVFGGKINCGDVHINCTVYSKCIIDGGWGTPQNKELLWAVAYCLASNAQMNINGGTYTITACSSEEGSTGNSHDDVCKNGYEHVFSGSVLYGSAVPVIADGNCTANYNNGVDTGSDRTFTACRAVNYLSTFSSSNLTPQVITRDDNNSAVDIQPCTTPTSGTYLTEAGDSIGPSDSTTMTRGSVDSSKVRVHVVYRFWSSSNRTGAPTYLFYKTSSVIDGATTQVVGSALGLNNVSGGLSAASASISYASGGASINSHYYTPYLVSSAIPGDDTNFSDYAVGTQKGTTFQTLSTSTTSSSFTADASKPCYVFEDFVAVASTTNNVTIGSVINADQTTFTANTTGTVTKYYNNQACPYGLMGIVIKNGTSDVTSDYDVTGTDSGIKQTVTFGWRASGSSDDYQYGSYPVNAGTYQYIMSIAADTSSPFNVNSKNRNEVSKTFTVTINKSAVNRGNLPASITMTYGSAFSDVLNLSSYTASGATTPKGSFTWVSGASTIPGAGTGTISLMWNPTSTGNSDDEINYTSTAFTVAYTCNKAALTVKPGDAVITYGDTTYSTPYSLVLNGLQSPDSSDARKAEILATAVFHIDSASGSYAAGATKAGQHKIYVTSITDTSVAGNYTITYDNSSTGYLTVAKRLVYAKGTGVNRAYNGNNTVSVTWSNYTHIFQNSSAVDDDVYFAQCDLGTAAQSDVGTGIAVTVITDNISLLGADKDNYTPAISGSITVNITQAQPGVAVPVISGFEYLHSKTLTDDMLNYSGYSTGNSVTGTWAWDSSVKGTIPKVSQSTYLAVFTPTDTTNYATQLSNVTVSVTPATVTVSKNISVVYGDAVSGLSSVTYTCDNDTGFQIGYANIQGNLTFSTTYAPGSSVGSYPITYNVSDYADKDGNYKFVTGSSAITVTSRPVTVSVAAKTITYGDAAPAASSYSVSISGMYSGDDTTKLVTPAAAPVWSFTLEGYSQYSNAGSYNIIPALSSSQTVSANYSLNYVNGRLTVNKADLTITASDATVTYGQDPPTSFALTYSGFLGSDTADSVFGTNKPTASTTYVKLSPVTSDGYPISVNTSSASSVNYNLGTVSGRLTVVKANPTISVYPTASMTYTQTLADAAFSSATATPSGGTFAFVNTSEAPVPGTYTTYQVTYTPSASYTQNYNTLTFTGVTLTVAKKAISGSVGLSGSPMVSSVMTANLSLLSPAYDASVYDIKWYSTKDSTVLSSGTTYTVQEADKNYSLYFTVTCKTTAYYTGTLTCNNSSPICQKLTVPTIYQLALDQVTMTGSYSSSIVYDGQSHVVSVTQDSSVGDGCMGNITVNYNNSSSNIPNDAGTYKITVDIAAPNIEGQTITTNSSGQTINASGDVIYGPVSNLEVGTLTITQKDYNVILTISSKDYDGTNTAAVTKTVQSGAVSGSTTDQIYFDSSKTTYSFDNVNAGSNKTVSAANARNCMTGTAAANYDLVLTLKKATVYAIPLSVTAVPEARAYDPASYSCVVNFTNSSGRAYTDSSSEVYINTGTATLEYNNAGTMNIVGVTGTIQGTKAGNYTLSVSNLSGLTETITKADPSVTTPVFTSREYNFSSTLSAVAFDDTDWSWATPTAKLPAGTNTFTAIYTPTDAENYNSLTRDIQVPVTKAALTISPVIEGTTSMDIVYGAAVPHYVVLVSGLTGETSDTDIAAAYSGDAIISCSYAQGSAVGSYAISASGSSYTSSNYTITYPTLNLNVVKRTVYTTLTPVTRAYSEGNKSITINCSALDNVYSGDSSSAKLSLSSYTLTGSVSTPDAGLKALTYTDPTLTGSSASNYKLTVYGKNQVTITKADPTGFSWPTSATVEYGQLLGLATFTGGNAGTGTLKMRYSSETPTAVGTYYANNDMCYCAFTPADTVNYNEVYKMITLVVTKDDLTPTVSYSGTYNSGETITVKVSNVPDAAKNYMTYKWYRVTSNDDYASEITEQNYLGEGATYKLTDNDIGYYVICVVSINNDSAPYTITETVGAGATTGATAMATAAVSKAVLNFWQKLWNWFYILLASIRRLMSGIGH